MLSARLGHFLDAPLSFLAGKIPFSPNTLTVTGFLMSVAAAFVIPLNIKMGGIFILISGLFDMLDGIVARTSGRATKFGAFLDSVLDRYSDAFIFLSLSYYLAAQGNLSGAFLSLGTLVGAFLISYARARAEGLGESCHTGIMERPERIILLIIATLTGWVVPILWAMLLLTHLTAIQRILHVWMATKKKY
jgi:phosphatidylglycerophosphate synthase